MTCRSLTCRLVLMLLLSSIVLTAGAQANYQRDYRERVTTQKLPLPLDARSLDKRPDVAAALEFLYAYMVLPDLTDHSRAFYAREVSTTLRARREMPWGSQVPEREWLHFVLPLRVNNERIDSFRSARYEELKARVAGLTMAEAVLAVNHWCHEYVTYKPSDARTSSPLASMRTATGRCGEESTFTVAALRAVGIPARQVYTPRWAHTDDNHAWVEAWVDGKWHFLGACEPEPVLDLGWFNAPASRGMLMHTKAFGRYAGAEDRMKSTHCYTEINVTENYAETARTTALVVDEAGRPVPDADIWFKLYNYAEFYTVYRGLTDATGRASITSGLGDLVAWTSKGVRYGFQKFSVGRDSVVTVVLRHRQGDRVQADLNIVPPKGRNNLPYVSPEAAAQNEKRKAHEDSIRHAYVAAFPDSVATAAFCRKEGYDYAAVRPLVEKSRGNSAALFRLLRDFKHCDVVAVLKSLSEKDLADFDYDILADHLRAGRVPKQVDAFAATYIYSPRIAYEPLSPWRSVLQRSFSQKQQEAFRRNPLELARWIAANVKADNTWNPLYQSHNPENALRLRTTDSYSRQRLFVAAARSLGIAAGIDPVTEKMRYALSPDAWVEVDFDQLTQTPPAAGEATAPTQLRLTYTPREYLLDPAYYTHFSLSALQNGAPVLQNYDGTWKELFETPRTIAAGDYLLVSGTRMADGSVLAHLEIFPVEKGRTTEIPLTMRQDSTQVQVIGSFNAENLYLDPISGQTKSLLSTTGRGYYVVGLVRPNHEPTNHILHDLSALKGDLEAWGRPILLLFQSEEDWMRFQKNRAEYVHLPATLHFGIDHQKQVADDLRLSGLMNCDDLPLVVIADTFNRVVFRSQGYTIGLGEQIKTIVGKINSPQ